MEAPRPAMVTVPAATAAFGATVLRLAAGVQTTQAGTGCVLRGAPLVRTGAWGWLARRLRMPDRVQVELDDIGAFVVRHLDGRPMDAVATALAGHLRLTRREAETSLAEFARQLLRRRLVEIAP
jgi:hypothetical protein